MRCAECGGTFEESIAPMELVVRGEPVVVEGIRHLLCGQCGEELIGAGELGAFQRRAHDIYRARHGYLTGEEIKAIRAAYSLGQEAFESLIGAGPKTLTRWESGAVLQPGVADTLLRVLGRFPIVAKWLADGAYPSYRPRPEDASAFEVRSSADVESVAVATKSRLGVAA